ncbi:MAG: hypothetical protein V2A73_17700, partial [Pseudomonadota bacterium]
TKLNGGLKFTSIPLQIAQDVEALTLIDPPEGFEMLSGRVTGSCVSFTTLEELEGADYIRYSYEGEAYSGKILGDFTGKGPGTCVSAGQFKVTITP